MQLSSLIAAGLMATAAAAPMRKETVQVQVPDPTPLQITTRQKGVCTNTICPFNFDPVCVHTVSGTYVTYSNPCRAEACGYSSSDWTTGVCQYSTRPLPTRPTCACPRNYDPVCANGITYANSCLARCHGMTTWDQGACNQDPRIHLRCNTVDGRTSAAQADVDGVTNSPQHWANFTFHASQAGFYTISTCDSDMDVQMLIDSPPTTGRWIDNDSCGTSVNGGYHGAEVVSMQFDANSDHTIYVRAWGSEAGAVRLTVNSSFCPTEPDTQESLECGQLPVVGYLHRYQNVTFPFRIETEMTSQNVVISSCRSNFDTVMTLYDSNMRFVMDNDDNFELCNNFSSAILLEGSDSNHLSAGDYYVSLRGFGGNSGNFSLELECGGGAPVDPCAHCPTGTYCQTLRNNATCQNWARNHPFPNNVPIPTSCRACLPPPPSPCAGGCSDFEYCSLSINATNVDSCCTNGPPYPYECYGCHSRVNPASYCPRSTQIQTTFTTVQPQIRETCGELEVTDADSCDKFCTNPAKQGGVSKEGKWTRPGRQRASCCCLDVDGSTNPQQCCVDTDDSTPPRSRCNLFDPCYSQAVKLSTNATVLAAVITQTTECDFAAPAGSVEHENCKAIQRAVRATLGSGFFQCCSCATQLPSKLPTNRGIRWMQDIDCSDY